MNAPAVLNRRLLLAGGIALAGAAIWARPTSADTPGLPTGGVLTFDIYLGQSHLGRHSMTFNRDGGALAVESHVDMLFKLGPISLVRYSHHALESWTAGRFDHLETSTVTNGRKQAVRAHKAEGAVLIEPAEGAAYTADAGLLPLTHWNRQIMDAPLFNPQDGKLLRERATPKGVDKVALANGRQVTATRYSLTGDTQIDDWYDDAGVWTALRGRLWDGSVLTYRRTEA
jgi:hypothetical protein